MHRYPFSDLFCLDPAPHRLYRSSIGKELLEFRNGIRHGIRSFSQKRGGFNSLDNLPTSYSTLAQHLVGMDTENKAIFTNGLTDVLGNGAQENPPTTTASPSPS